MFSLSHVLQTAETLLRYRNEDFLCDTILVAKDSQLKAHSVILSAVSPVFKAAFCTGSFPTGTFQVDLPDVDSEVLQMALDFIYTGELILPSPSHASPANLSTLFSTLQDLGLDIEKLNGSEMKFKSELKSERADESVKGFGKDEDNSEVEDEEESFSTDLDLSALNGSEVASKKADDEWNWTEVQMDSEKPGTAAVSDDDDDLENLTGDGKIPGSIKEDGCMFIEMAGTEEGPKFIVVAPQTAEAMEAGNTEGSDDSGGIHKCKTCSRQFARKQALVRHERSHTSGHACTLCGESFDGRMELDAHMRSKHVSQPSSSLVRCSTCQKECSSLFEFNLHLEESPDCASGDVQSRVMVMSSDAAEVNYRPFLCDMCGKNFSTALSLRMHHKLHTGERPFACSTCHKSFVQKVQLTQHELRHLGIRPFACSLCERTFSQKSQLTQHVRLHSGDRPFVCECGAGFFTKSMLTQHRRTHTNDRPHVCATCGKAFAYKESLVVHIRTHTGEKPFECAICGSRYTQSHHLKGHLRTHTGEKPFQCEMCPKTYKNRVDLRFHCTRVHSVDITKRHAKPQQFVALN